MRPRLARVRIREFPAALDGSSGRRQRQDGGGRLKGGREDNQLGEDAAGSRYKCFPPSCCSVVVRVGGFDERRLVGWCGVAARHRPPVVEVGAGG
jgi:hypothetical protein